MQIKTLINTKTIVRPFAIAVMATTLAVAPLSPSLAMANSGEMQNIATVKSQASVVNRLSQLLSGYDRLSARFEQSVTRTGSSQGDVQAGQFSVAKPNRFVWNVETPFPQEIVSDGEYVWIYDPDLEQVTQKRADNRQDNAAALILNGRVDALDEQFLIRAVPLVAQPATELFELTPRQENSNFSRIRLLFNAGVLSEFLLEDQLGQRTAVVLSQVEINPVLADSLFDFKVPEGVDLIVDDAR